MNAKVSTTTVKQLGNEILGTKDKEQHFLIIETEVGKRVIQIGKSTLEDIDKLEPKTQQNEPSQQPEGNTVDEQNSTGGRGNRGVSNRNGGK